ncbi:MAG: immunoglobulin domain-containing protein [Acidobacteria bacterium]|nr:immunoglobulin domain-containing protein [Acidobacteriota bacterium]
MSQPQPGKLNELKGPLPSFFVAGQGVGLPQKDGSVLATLPTPKGPIQFDTNGAHFIWPLRSNKRQQADPQKDQTLLLGFNRKNKISDSQVVLEEPLSTQVNFLVGPPQNWATHVPAYRKLTYSDVWPGISVTYVAQYDQLGLELCIAPDHFAQSIRLETGASQADLQSDGSIVVAGSTGTLRFAPPQAYQWIQGQKVPVEVAYEELPGGGIGFKVATHQTQFPLVIHPQIMWSTFLGGPGGPEEDTVTAMTRDAADNLYLAGTTAAADFPTTTGAYAEINSGSRDLFICKMNPSGTALEYATFLGGSGSESVFDIQVDAGGNAYLCGSTSSTDFPVTAGVIDSFLDYGEDGFVCKLNNSGTAMVFATYLGGDSADEVRGLVLESDGNILLAGRTNSSNFPTTMGAYDTSYNGLYDTFVSRINGTGTAVLQSTFYGGTSHDDGFVLAKDASGNIFVAGETLSLDCPTTAGAFATSSAGGLDGFLIKLNPSLSLLLFATYFGGSDYDNVVDLQVSSAGNAYMLGYTESTDLPTTTGAYAETASGSIDGFLCEFNPAGSGLVFSTYLGGSVDDFPMSLAVDGISNILIAGQTYSWDFPTTSGVYDPSWNGGSDAFIAQISADGSSLSYGTYLGGLNDDQANTLVVLSTGDIVVAGKCLGDFPTSPGAFDETHNGGVDGFVTKISADFTDKLFSTFLGGSGPETAQAIAKDDSDQIYVCGSVESNLFPTTPGSYNTSNSGGSDAYVAKLNATGDSLLYATFIGGSGHDKALGIVVDSMGRATLVGHTESSDFPTTAGAWDTSFNGGEVDGFICQLDPTGASLNFSSFLGGSSFDEVLAIRQNSADSFILVGSTSSSNFPTVAGSYDDSHNGGLDAFVVGINPTGDSLDFSTFLGGSGTEYSSGLALDDTDKIYVVGSTSSTNLPITAGVIGPTYVGNLDTFVAKFSKKGDSLEWATYLGGSGQDRGIAVVVDSLYNPYVTGFTLSTNFPTTPGAFDTTLSAQDIYVTKLNPTASALVYSTYIGGSGYEQANAMILNKGELPILTGYTTSVNFPTVAGSFSTEWNGSKDAFVLMLNDTGNALEYSTYLGGPDVDEAKALVLMDYNIVTVTGNAGIDFPTTAGSLSETVNGSSDTFISQIRTCIPVTLTAHPVDAAICPGASVTFEVTATGSGTLEYQWQKDDVNIPGETASSLTLSSVSASDEGAYSCIVDNGCQSITSEHASLNVLSTPSISSSPSPTTVCPGDSILMTTVASGGSLTYQWRKDGMDIPGETSAFFSISSVQASDAGDYSCLVSNDCGSATSASATLTVNMPIFLNAHPSGQIRCEGQSASFNVSGATGSSLSYAWSKNGTPIPGANSAIYTIASVSAADEAGYACTITNPCGSLTTLPALLTVREPLSIIQQPEDISMCSGLEAHFSVMVAGDGPITYQWFHGATLLSGETNAALTIANVQAGDVGLYRCYITGPCGNITSDSAQLSLGGSFSIQTTPPGQALGLAPPAIGLSIGCGSGSEIVAWDADPPTPMVPDGDGIILDPPPTSTTVLDVTVTDPVSGTTLTDRAVVLVPHNPGYDDYNGDGCNNLLDLYAFLVDWRLVYLGDPDNDGRITVLDFLYINLKDPISCSE